MFLEHPKEQELYHAIATVGTLLLQIGEVGKKFYMQREGDGGAIVEKTRQLSINESATKTEGPDSGISSETASAQKSPDQDSTSQSPEKSPDQDSTAQDPEKSPDQESTNQSTENSPDQKSANDSPKKSPDRDSTNQSPESLPCQDSANRSPEKSPDQDKATNESLAEQAIEQEGAKSHDEMSASELSSAQSMSTSPSLVDMYWSITFEQFLASMLTEPALVEFFEERRDLSETIDKFRNRRLYDRSNSTASSM